MLQGGFPGADLLPEGAAGQDEPPVRGWRAGPQGPGAEKQAGGSLPALLPLLQHPHVQTEEQGRGHQGDWGVAKGRGKSVQMDMAFTVFQDFARGGGGVEQILCAKI